MGSRQLRVNEGRDHSSTVGDGWRFTAGDANGNEITIRVMQTRDCDWFMPAQRAREAIAPYLDEAQPPGLLVINREGRIRLVR